MWAKFILLLVGFHFALWAIIDFHEDAFDDYYFIVPAYIATGLIAEGGGGSNMALFSAAGVLAVILALPLFILPVSAFMIEYAADKFGRVFRRVLLGLGILTALAGIVFALIHIWGFGKLAYEFSNHKERFIGVPIKDLGANLFLVCAGGLMFWWGLVAFKHSSSAMDLEGYEPKAIPKTLPADHCDVCEKSFGKMRKSKCGRCRQFVHRDCLSAKANKAGRICQKCLR